MSVAPEATPADHVDGVALLPGDDVTGILIVLGVVEYLTHHHDGSSTVVIRGSGSHDYENRYVCVVEPADHASSTDVAFHGRLRMDKESRFVIIVNPRVMALIGASPRERPVQAAIMHALTRLAGGAFMGMNGPI